MGVLVTLDNMSAIQTWLSKSGFDVEIPLDVLEHIRKTVAPLCHAPWETSIVTVRDGDLCSERNNMSMKDPEMLEYGMMQHEQNWSPNEINLAADVEKFRTANPRVIRLVLEMLGFLIPGDGMVIDMVDRFKREAKTREEDFYYAFQSAIEAVHAIAYMQAAQTLYSPDDVQHIRTIVDHLPEVKAKADFMEEYTMSEYTKGLRFVAAAASEGVFFVGIFSLIFFMRNMNYLDAFIFLNEQVAKDEFLHRDVACVQAKRCLAVPEESFTREEAIEVLKRAGEIEIAHIEYLLREPIVSAEADLESQVTAAHISRFIYGLMDQILDLIGFEPHFTSADGLTPGTVQEFSPPWMITSSTTSKTNQFENRVGAYKMTSKKRDGADEYQKSVTNPKSIDF